MHYKKQFFFSFFWLIRLRTLNYIKEELIKMRNNCNPFLFFNTNKKVGPDSSCK